MYRNVEKIKVINPIVRKPIPLSESPSSTLCKSCGLCCTGYLFFDADCKASEVIRIQALGITVLNADQGIPKILLPCPLWNEICTIYSHPHKPSICNQFKCKLLKEVEREQFGLNDALIVVHQAKEKIRELEDQLPIGRGISFRRRLLDHVSQLEGINLPTNEGSLLRLKVGALLIYLRHRFG